MVRSVWKGPFVEGSLLKKADAARASGHAHLDAGHEGIQGVGHARPQPTKTPPEGCRISPVKNADSSDARKSAVLAISCAVP